MGQVISTSEEKAAWAALAALRLAIRPQEVLDAFGGPLPLFELSLDSLRQALPWSEAQLTRLLSARPLDRMIQRVEQLQDKGVWLVAYGSPDYPPLLQHIARPPAALWCKGAPAVLGSSGVAIVGSRSASTYGIRVARLLGAQLAEHGITVISGGARGIDAAAHEGAISSGGSTIAVFGTGIERSYPDINRNLFEKIAGHGACISEFAPDAAPRPENFPIRNRIISGLSLGVVIVEAGDRSGALVTARCALEQDREVFAVPGDIDRPQSNGANRLIQRGAHLVSDATDIIQEISPHLSPNRNRAADPGPPRGPVVPFLSPEGSTVFGCLSEDPAVIDDIILRSGLPTAKVLELLMELELSGLAAPVPGHGYRRALHRD